MVASIWEKVSNDIERLGNILQKAKSKISSSRELRKSVDSDSPNISPKQFKKCPDMFFNLQEEAEELYARLYRRLTLLKKNHETEIALSKTLIRLSSHTEFLGDDWTKLYLEVVRAGQERIREKFGALRAYLREVVAEDLTEIIALTKVCRDRLTAKIKILKIAKEEMLKYRQRWSLDKKLVKRARKRERLRAFILKHRNKACADCGHFKDGEMTFDHLRDKSFDIAGAASARRSFARIYKEIIKCEVVCRDCHDVREYKRGRMFQRNTPKSIIQGAYFYEEENGASQEEPTASEHTEAPPTNEESQPQVPNSLDLVANLGRANRAEIKKIAKLLKRKNVSTEDITKFFRR